MYLVISLLVLRAGCGIWLYQFLIIAYLFTLYKILFCLVQCRVKEQLSYEPAHEIMVLFVLCKKKKKKKTRPSNAHAQPSSEARCLILVGPFVYFMCASSEGSGKTARKRRLAWAFAGRLCDKYHNLMSWLIWNCLRGPSGYNHILSKFYRL